MLLKAEEEEAMNLRLVEDTPTDTQRKEEDDLSEALRRSREDYQRSLDQEEADMALALSASLRDMQLWEAKISKEKAELEHAISLSMALEEERQRQIRNQRNSAVLARPQSANRVAPGITALEAY